MLQLKVYPIYKRDMFVTKSISYCQKRHGCISKTVLESQSRDETNHTTW